MLARIDFPATCVLMQQDANKRALVSMRSAPDLPVKFGAVWIWTSPVGIVEIMICLWEFKSGLVDAHATETRT